jgi:hypothetical protein
MRQVVVGVSLVYAMLVPPMAIVANGVGYAVALALCSLATPVWNIVFGTFQLMVTPDRLQGRVQSVVTLVSLLIVPAGQLAASAIFARFGPATAFAVFGSCLVILAVANVASRELRRLPRQAWAAVEGRQ